jgi:hypothetical protein
MPGAHTLIAGNGNQADPTEEAGREAAMYRLIWLAAFFAILGLYFIPGFWAPGVVLHCVLFFAWLVVAPGERRQKPEDTW